MDEKELIKGLFERDEMLLMSRGVCSIDKDGNGFIVRTDGRNVEVVKNNKVDAIITAHPWLDEKSNTGGTRHFNKEMEGKSFKYMDEDFKKKYNVLKRGGFLVEILPEENANNYDYIYEVKKMAEDAGFKYYCQVPWKKGKFVSNTGRKSKNCETVMFFTKGNPRKLREDKKKMKKFEGEKFYMRGTAKMLPTQFDVNKTKRKNSIVTTEKPVALYEEILDFITEPGEIVLDQFGGSFNVMKACLNKNRKCITIENDDKYIVKFWEYMNEKSKGAK